MLKTLNCNSETPYLIWNNGTRAELLEFLETRRQTRDVVADLTIDDSFVYSAHIGELIIGNIFVRIYNEQPTYQIEVRYFLKIDAVL